MLKQIQMVLDRDVRPELARHEGDLVIDSYQDGILKVRLLGRCSQCSSAQRSTEAIIKTKVIEALPEVKDVVLIQGVSNALMEMARTLLSQRHTT